MGQKESCVKIPILEKEDYFHLKVKMHLHLLSLDTIYVKCLKSGPCVPMKIFTRWRRWFSV